MAPPLLAPLTVSGAPWDLLSELGKELLFTDGSALIVRNSALWKDAVYHHASGISPAEKGFLGSARMAELVVACLDLQHAVKMTLPKAHLFMDSWVVANGLIVLSAKWQKDNFITQGKPPWKSPFGTR